MEKPLHKDNCYKKPLSTQQIEVLWHKIRDDAALSLQNEPSLREFLQKNILDQPNLNKAISHRVAGRLHCDDLSFCVLIETFSDFFNSSNEFSNILAADIMAVYDRDPAWERAIEPVLFFKGFHALVTHRLSHYLWHQNRQDFALYLQSRASSIFQTDIHPMVSIGSGVFLDHATGIVIGATAVIEDNVSILQGVTLGGTGKEHGDRHPKIRHGVLIGAGAKVLGNIEIGCCARIAAGSVVLKPVPPCKTVAGVPARIVGEAGCAEPAIAMNQMLDQT